MLCFNLLYLVSITTLAQDKKWSVEANYPISIAGDLGNDNPGVIDIGIKYRFLDLKAGKIGAGFNTGVFYDKLQRGLLDPATSRDFIETN